MKKSLLVLAMLAGGAAFAADDGAPAGTEAEQEAREEGTQVNPDGVTVKRGLGGTVEEFRIGGRLESMKVDRDRGSTDYWYDRRGDSTWEAEQDEVGEKRNARQWEIGNW